jgi:ABC-type multidrug transport system fused ATPase/permease subunit
LDPLPPARVLSAAIPVMVVTTLPLAARMTATARNRGLYRSGGAMQATSMVAVPAVVAAIVGLSGLTALALIRPAFAVVVAVALAVALTGDLVAGRRGRRAGGELARARAAARARLVEVLDGRTDIATYGAGPRALAELGGRFRATDAPRRPLVRP